MTSTELPSELRYATRYATSKQLGFRSDRTEQQIAEMLGRLSVYDCLGMIGRLNATLYVEQQSEKPRVQLRLIDWLASFDDEWRARLTHALSQGTMVVFPQQLAHLTRLAVRYADRRPANDFGDDGSRRAFLKCLFGVPDLFYDPNVDLRNEQDRLSWALRHSAIGFRRDRLTLWSTYFEVFCRIWPSLAADGVPDADEAFRRFTGMPIQTFMAAGMAFSSAFAAQDEDAPGRASVAPEEYFATTKLQGQDWRAFLSVSATSIDQLAQRLDEEDSQFGPTTFGALAFEQTPLVVGPEDRVYLISLESLERRVTEGILHILAEGSVAEGEERERYTAPFGQAFQLWAEACLRRANHRLADPPELFFDVPYGTKSQPKRTPDVVLRSDRALVAAEIVSGPLQARTVTHGDLDAFNRDLSKLIDKKADQLTKRIREILDGETRNIGLAAADHTPVWPVIVTSTAFPHHPFIGPAIRKRLRGKRLLSHRRVRVLSIIGAEELAAAEGAIAEGTPFDELLRAWKHTSDTGDHSFKNFLIFREKDQRRRPSEHLESMYREASRAMIGEVLHEDDAAQALLGNSDEDQQGQPAPD